MVACKLGLPRSRLQLVLTKLKSGFTFNLPWALVELGWVGVDMGELGVAGSA